MSEQIKEVLELVEEAQSKDKFSLQAVIKGAGNPTDTVDIFLDQDALYKLSELSDLITEEIDEERVAVLEKEADALREKLFASRVTFYLQGIDQRQIESVEKEAKALAEAEGLKDDEWLSYYMSGLVAANIVKVENAAGEFEEKQYTLKEVEELRGAISAESWYQLHTTMQRLTLATGYFKGLTDAGFLPKS